MACVLCQAAIEVGEPYDYSTQLGVVHAGCLVQHENDLFEDTHWTHLGEVPGFPREV